MGRESGQSSSSVAGGLYLAGVSSPAPSASQMVFYIEACESGSMMNHLPDNINGRWLGCRPRPGLASRLLKYR